MKVKVCDLLVGDVLTPTMRVVTHAPSVGVATSSGKMDLGLHGYAVQFRKNTVVSIIERKHE